MENLNFIDLYKTYKVLKVNKNTFKTPLSAPYNYIEKKITIISFSSRPLTHKVLAPPLPRI